MRDAVPDPLARKVRASPVARWLFETRSGEIVIGQRANPPLIAAVVLSLLGLVVRVPVVSVLSGIAWAVWAALELVLGVNPFRRILGLVVLAGSLAGLLIGR